MILPIYAYGHPVLKKVAEPIGPDYPELKDLIENMWETMENATGVGLAAPQIGLSIRLFVVDTHPTFEEDEEGKGVRMVFINAEILHEEGEEWSYEEGCLSIPNVRGDVIRPPTVTIRYQDEHFKEHTKTFDGMNARVIQHEYDHIEGILFTEKLKPVKKAMVRRKLDAIKKGTAKADYRIKFIN